MVCVCECVCVCVATCFACISNSDVLPTDGWVNFIVRPEQQRERKMDTESDLALLAACCDSIGEIVE